MSDDATRQRSQIDLAERLQNMLLEDFERLLESSEMTPTDRATLARLLSQNGWSLDPSRLPQGIKDKLTDAIDPENLDDEVDVIPIDRKTA